MYCIITDDPTEWNCERLIGALKKAEKSFFSISIKDIIAYQGKKPYVRAKGHDLDACSKIFVRDIPSESPEQFIFHMDILHRLENLGVECINSPSALEKCIDKFYTTSIFEDAGLRVPLTVCCENYDDAYSAFLEMKDVVVKPLCGSLGTGITRIQTEDMAYRFLRSLEFHKYIFYVQEYLEHKNEDFRLLTCRDEVICVAKRKAQSWITNVHQGAKPERFNPTEEMMEMALTASRLLGCHYCGVDILESRGELYIIEANGIPDMNVHQPVEDFDVASKVVELLE
jgi:RimK family alpha-L-glutamate ligase